MEKHREIGKIEVPGPVPGDAPGAVPEPPGGGVVYGTILRGDGTREVVGAPAASRRRRRALFVEADQERRGAQLPRLVRLAEGEREGKLVRPYYFAAEAPVPAAVLWQAVRGYIEAQYDLACLEHILLYGDGAPWVREGAAALPRCVFLLHPFYIKKWLTPALVLEEEGFGREVWAAIQEGDQLAVERLLRQAERRAPNATFSHAIRGCRHALRRHWDGIAAYRLLAGHKKIFRQAY
ncbi:MAG: UPF0236 family transposase-like protein [Bacillota bacterium]